MVNKNFERLEHYRFWLKLLNIYKCKGIFDIRILTDNGDECGFCLYDEDIKKITSFIESLLL